MLKRNLIIASVLLIVAAAAIVFKLAEVDGEIMNFLTGLMFGACIAFLLSFFIKERKAKK